MIKYKIPIKFKTISICEDKMIKFCSFSKKGYKKIRKKKKISKRKKDLQKKKKKNPKSRRKCNYVRRSFVESP